MRGARFIICGIAAVAAATVSGCGSTAASESAAPATTSAPKSLAVGNTATTDDMVVTLVSYGDNVLGISRIEHPSNRAMAKVRVCAGANATTAIRISASDFHAVLDDETSLPASAGGESSFPAMVKPSECADGTLHWQLPEGQHPRAITNVATETTWTLSCPATPGACVQPQFEDDATERCVAMLERGASVDDCQPSATPASP